MRRAAAAGWLSAAAARAAPAPPSAGLAGGAEPRALADYDAALNLNPQSATAYYGRGAILHELGDVAGVRQAYAGAAGPAPVSAESFTNRGQAGATQGDSVGARADLARAADLFRELGATASAARAGRGACSRGGVTSNSARTQS